MLMKIVLNLSEENANIKLKCWHFLLDIGHVIRKIEKVFPMTLSNGVGKKGV
ncbi:hypothetical protein ACFDTO_22395 [Microbacteriaceae bacterium 4G12]